jgi:Holliday junction resolvase
MSTPENAVKLKVVKQLASVGAYYFFPATGGYGRSGVPDIVCCYKGRFVGIECKARGKRPTALQQSNLEDIVRHGGISVVVDESSVDSFKEIFLEITNEN